MQTQWEGGRKEAGGRGGGGEVREKTDGRNRSAKGVGKKSVVYPTGCLGTPEGRAPRFCDNQVPRGKGAVGG